MLSNASVISFASAVKLQKHVRSFYSQQKFCVVSDCVTDLLQDLAIVFVLYSIIMSIEYNYATNACEGN